MAAGWVGRGGAVEDGHEEVVKKLVDVGRLTGDPDSSDVAGQGWGFTGVGHGRGSIIGLLLALNMSRVAVKAAALLAGLLGHWRGASVEVQAVHIAVTPKTRQI